ncbi:MAG: YbaB/EbfC family nucleoid-associated protein [Candidatus Paceibacterota bacterium]
MFDSIKGLGNLAKLQSQARTMQSALQQEKVEVEKDGVKVVMSGDQKVLEVTIDGVLENRVTNVINEAVKRTQELAAKKLIEISQKQG